MFERGGTDDDRLLNVAHFLEQRGGGNRLDSFAKSHVIGEHGTASEGEVQCAFFLVRIQLCGKHVEGAASALDLIEEPFLLLLDFFAVLQQGQIFKRRFIHTDERLVARWKRFNG